MRLFKQLLELFKEIKDILYFLEEIHNGFNLLEELEELEEILYKSVPDYNILLNFYKLPPIPLFLILLPPLPKFIGAG